jgi:undecaprenyl-diphosphatase
MVDTAAGAILSGVVAYASLRFLTRCFRVGRLTPSAIYCLIAGLVSFAVFALLSLGIIHLPW